MTTIEASLDELFRLRAALADHSSLMASLASGLTERSVTVRRSLRTGVQVDVPHLPTSLDSLDEASAAVAARASRALLEAADVERSARRFAALEMDASTAWQVAHLLTDEFHALFDHATDLAVATRPSRGPSLAAMTDQAMAVLHAALIDPTLAPRRRQLLTALQHRLATHPDLQLLELGGGGQIVLVHGDLSTADRVAIVVPGVGNDLDRLRESSPWNTQAARLRAAVGHHSATIEWIDDPSPDVSIADATDIVTDGHARAAATRLRRFVDQVRRETSAPIAVIGHSYGAVAASVAAAQGLDADALYLVGSPGAGIGIRSVDDYRLARDATVLSLRTSDDPIATAARVGGLGDDPMAPSFGPSVLLGAGGHSAYFVTGGEALTTLARDLLAVTPPRPDSSPSPSNPEPTPPWWSKAVPLAPASEPHHR